MTTPNDVLAWTKVLGPFVFGGLALSSSAWVFTKLRTLKLPGLAFASLGTILLVAPFSDLLRFKVDGTKIEFEIKALREQMSETGKGIASLNNKVSEAGKRIASLNNKVEALPAVYSASAEDIARQVKTLQASLSAVENQMPKFAKLEGKLDKVQQTVASVENRVSKSALVAYMPDPYAAFGKKPLKKFYSDTGVALYSPGKAPNYVAWDDISKFLEALDKGAKKKTEDITKSKTPAAKSN